MSEPVGVSDHSVDITVEYGACNGYHNHTYQVQEWSNRPSRSKPAYVKDGKVVFNKNLYVSVQQYSALIYLSFYLIITFSYYEVSYK